MILPRHLTKAILKVRDTYVKKYHYSIMDIADGDCENFVDDVFIELGIKDGQYRVNSADTIDYMKESFIIDVDRLIKLGEPVPSNVPTTTLEQELGGATHHWIRFRGLNYDAETPKGVKHFLELPFFQRHLNYITRQYSMKANTILEARSVLNTTEIDQFIQKHQQRTDNDFVKKWLAGTLRKHIINNLTSVRKVKKADPDSPDWLKKALAEKQEVVRVTLTPQFDNQVSHIVDFLNSFILTKQYGAPFKQALHHADLWTKSLNKKAAKVDDIEGTTILRKYNDGFCWRNLQSEDALSYEGKHMSHCVSGYAKAVAKGTQIWSLRDPYNKPHVTIEYRNGSIVQIKGFANNAIKVEYSKYVADIINNPPPGITISSVRDVENARLLKRGKVYKSIYDFQFPSKKYIGPENTIIKYGIVKVEDTYYTIEQFKKMLPIQTKFRPTVKRYLLDAGIIEMDGTCFQKDHILNKLPVSEKELKLSEEVRYKFGIVIVDGILDVYQHIKKLLPLKVNKLDKINILWEEDDNLVYVDKTLMTLNQFQKLINNNKSVLIQRIDITPLTYEKLKEVAVIKYQNGMTEFCTIDNILSKLPIKNVYTLHLYFKTPPHILLSNGVLKLVNIDDVIAKAKKLAIGYDNTLSVTPDTIEGNKIVVKDPLIVPELMLDGMALKTIPKLIKAKELTITGDFAIKYDKLVSDDMFLEANCTINHIKTKTLDLKGWVKALVKQIDADYINSDGIFLTAKSIKANNIKLWSHKVTISKCKCTDFKQQEYKLIINNIVADKVSYDHGQVLQINSGTINLLRVVDPNYLKISPNVHIKKLQCLAIKSTIKYSNIIKSLNADIIEMSDNLALREEFEDTPNVVFVKYIVNK